MKTHTLTITFAGICTHFRNVVAGVPYRVVLPDATQFRTGELTVEGATVPYYIVPHFPALLGDWDFAAGDLISAKPDILYRAKGEIRQGVRIQVLNSIDESITGDLEKVPHLTGFVADYNFASDVVMNGRAACYLDLFGGALSTQTVFRDVIQAVVTLETRGMPELLVTPLQQSTTSQSYRLRAREQGESVSLRIQNLETWQEAIVADSDGSYDYLLHYLTARGGIPSSITGTLPGMKLPLTPPTAGQIHNAMLLSGFSVSERLLGTAPPPEASMERLQTQMEYTEACSDSQYP